MSRAEQIVKKAFVVLSVLKKESRDREEAEEIVSLAARFLILNSEEIWPEAAPVADESQSAP